MPVINPAKFDSFFKSKVIKRAGLLKEGARETHWGSAMKSRIPASSVESKIYYTGELKTARNGIAMISFNDFATNSAEGILIFNWSWSQIQSHLSSISVYDNYLNQISSIGVSKFNTATISQVYRWVRSPDNQIVTQEIRDVIILLNEIDKITSPGSGIVKNVVGNKLLSITGVSDPRKQILNSLNKINPVRNVEALTNSVLSDIKNKFTVPSFNPKTIANKSIPTKGIKSAKLATKKPRITANHSIKKGIKKI